MLQNISGVSVDGAIQIIVVVRHMLFHLCENSQTLFIFAETSVGYHQIQLYPENIIGIPVWIETAMDCPSI